MDIARVNEIFIDSFGEVDENQQPLDGSEVFNFFVIAVALKPLKVRQHAPEMIEILKEWPRSSWGQPVPPLGAEINYLIAGAVLDDQRRAFLLFAFGKVLDWWNILDPHTLLGLDYDNPVGKQLAAIGMVSILGYRP